jgi:N4-gp56 family major capsid protein
MSIQRFKPEIWSARLLVALRKTLIYAGPQIVNRDYEGEISAAGDTVRITSIGRPTISNYVPGVTSINPEQLTDAQRTLVIDQSKYFAFEVDDVDARQARGNVLPQAADESAYGLADVIDQYVASFYTGASVANQLGTVAVTTGDIAYNTLVDLSVKLDEANVPTEGRYVVIPPWYHGLLRKNTNFINAEKAADGGAALRNGQIGEAAGFAVLKSNNTPLVTGDDYAVTAGTNAAISFGEQINKTEAYRPQDSFSDAIKGLALYGAKLVRPDNLATVIASKS